LHCFGVVRQMFIEKYYEFGAERFDVSIEGQLHGHPFAVEPPRPLCAFRFPGEQ
jgi:hypothetical protein